MTAQAPGSGRRRRCALWAVLVGLAFAPVIIVILIVATLWISFLGGATVGGFGEAAQPADEPWVGAVVLALWIVLPVAEYLIITRAYRRQLRRVVS